MHHESRGLQTTSQSDREHTQAIRKLPFDRWLGSEEALKAMHAMLPGDLKPQFDKQIGNFRQRLAEQRERETNPQRANP